MGGLAKGSRWVLGVFSVLVVSLFVLLIYNLIAFVLVGHEVISGGVLGSDSWAFITRLKLLSDYFPDYPFWNYLEGGGVSLTYSYPILTHTIVIVTAKLFSWTLAESLKFWIYGSVIVFGLGIFVYAWVRLRIFVVAFLAGLFYIISPIAWMWPFEWGFIAEHIAGMFFPFTILFFDLFILRALDKDFSIRTRIYLLFTVIFLALSFLGHPFVFTGAIAFMLFYGVVVSIIRKKDKFRTVLRFGIYFAGVFFAFMLLAGFWLFPFYNYTGLAGSGGNQSSNPPKWTEEYDRNDLTLSHVFSINPPREYDKVKYLKEYETPQEGDSVFDVHVLGKGYIFRNLSFPLAISILFLISIPTSIILWRKKFPMLILAALILIFISVSMPFIFLIHNVSFYLAKLPLLGLPLVTVISWLSGWRGNMFAARLMVPVGAAFGAYGILALLTYPIKFLEKKFVFRVLKAVILSVAALAVAASVLYYFRYKPALLPYQSSYGKEVSFSGRATNIRNILHEKRFEEIEAELGKGINIDTVLNKSLGLCTAPELKDNFICANEKLSFYFDASRIMAKCKESSVSICGGFFSDLDVDNWASSCDKGIDPFPSIDLCGSRSDLFGVVANDLSLEKINKKVAEFKQNDFLLNFDEKVDKQLKATLDEIPEDAFIRYDQSPMVAIFSMAGPYFKTTPQMTSYINNASLINRMWGYQVSNFYPPNEKVYTDPASIPEISKYFGISYLISHPSDPIDKLEKGGYQRLKDGSAIFKFSDPEPLITISTRPSVLVIGDEAKRVFELVFRKANFGLVSYDKAILVNGGEYIDSYSVDELNEFEVIFLYGYKYRNKNKAWALIDSFVKNGGRLFVDTGWQYVSADWKADKTPDFLPLEKLDWTNYGKTKDYTLNRDLIEMSGIDINGFSPLVWEDGPWGVSSSDLLKSWARPILTVSGHPLVVGGNLGNGRVIWSGMNLLGHSKVYDSTNPENTFAAKLIDWLFEGLSGQSLVFRRDFNAARISPDRMDVSINKQVGDKSFLYFKESVHPFWKAKLLTANREVDLKIFKAGPGFVFLELPPVNIGDKILLYIEEPIKHLIFKLISIGIFILLVVYVVYPKVFKIKLNPRFRQIVLRKKSSVLSSEEEDY